MSNEGGARSESDFITIWSFSKKEKKRESERATPFYSPSLPNSGGLLPLGRLSCVGHVVMDSVRSLTVTTSSFELVRLRLTRHGGPPRTPISQSESRCAELRVQKSTGSVDNYGG